MAFKLKIPPQFEECHLGKLPQHHQSYFSKTKEALESEGFELIGYYCGGIQRRKTLYIALFKHHNHRDRAIIQFLTSLQWVELYTEFVQKESIETTNSPHADIVHILSEKRNFSFPQIRDIHRLYSLHKKLIQQYVGDAEPLLLEDGEELERLKHAMSKDFERFANAHHFYFDSTSHAYRPTWKGAVLMTLMSLVPIRPILVRRNAAKLLKQLEAQ